MKHLLVDDHLFELPLGGSSLDDLLVDSVGRNQPVDHHWPYLTYPVTSVLSLRNERRLFVTNVTNEGDHTWRSC